MPTANQLLGLIKSHTRGDEERFYALTLQLAASEERKGHQKLARELRSLADEALNARRAESHAGEKPIAIVRPRGELAGFVSASYPKTRLNHLKKAPKGPQAGFFGLSSMAESAGLSVSALNAEKSTETAIVTANCL